MVQHMWGDEDFDWKALDEACIYLEKRCRQFARFGVHTKEKYGTMRVSTTVAFLSEYDFISGLIYPGYCNYMFSRWFRTHIDWPLGKVLRKLGIIRAVQWYQFNVFKFFWKRAAKKWPHIAAEILDEYDWMIKHD